MAGLVIPARGQVVWGQTDIAVLAEHRRDAFRRDHFGLIFADSLLFEELSAMANASVAATFAPPAIRQDIVQRAQTYLERLGVPGVNGVWTLCPVERDCGWLWPVPSLLIPRYCWLMNRRQHWTGVARTIGRRSAGHG